MTTQNQKQRDEFENPRKAPGDQDQKTRDTKANDPVEGSRFDKERQDRDRSTYESQNQGQGPNNVGDQSRTR